MDNGIKSPIVDFQNNRISSLEKFINLKNKMIWLVTVPHGDSKIDSTSEIYANSFISEWIVDDCYSIYGNKITIEDANMVYDMPIFSPHATKFKKNNDEISKYLISLHDYNIVNCGEIGTNHAAFYDKESAETYRIWLLMNFPKSEIYDLIDSRTINCRLERWDNFLRFGLTYDGIKEE